MLVVWNLAANLVVPAPAAVAVNLLAAALLVAIARRHGASWRQLGLRPDRRGAGVGAVAMVAVVGAVLLAAAIPATRPWFADDRLAGVGRAELWWHVLVRIPLGTAVAEEVAFRGVLLGVLLPTTTRARAVLVSSGLFGLWHVLPALDATAATTAVTPTPTVVVAGVLGQVVVAGLAGVGFAWLRLAGNGVVAPVLAHWGLNGTAAVAAWVVLRNAPP